MYLSEPEKGGGTVFPDLRLEVAPKRGNAVFFSYERAHPSTQHPAWRLAGDCRREMDRHQMAARARICLKTASPRHLESPMQIKANGIAIEVEDTGADGIAGRPAGGAADHGPGHAADRLAAAAGAGAGATPGYRVVRHDNRDIGLSQHFDAAGCAQHAVGHLEAQAGLYHLRTPYTAGRHGDGRASACWTPLKISQAHVVGVSMGGMIAQRVAIGRPRGCAA